MHGDDPCIGPDGQDVYAEVKRRGMFKSIPRTEGVSTTEIVGRMLVMSKKHHITDDGAGGSSSDEGAGHGDLLSESMARRERKLSEEGARGMKFGPYRESRFLTTSRMLRLFSQPSPRPILPGMKVRLRRRFVIRWESSVAIVACRVYFMSSSVYPKLSPQPSILFH